MTTCTVTDDKTTKHNVWFARIQHQWFALTKSYRYILDQEQRKQKKKQNIPHIRISRKIQTSNCIITNQQLQQLSTDE